MKKLKNKLNKIYRSFELFFSNVIGIDLGTSHTTAFLEGHGAIFNEPTLVALNKRTGQIVSIGEDSRTMLGRNPEYIEIIQPIKRGVISDYEITEQLFFYIFKKAESVFPKILGPSLIVGVPCNIGQTELELLKKAALDAGTRKIDFVYEPIAGLVGLGVNFGLGTSTTLIDVGGGTADILIVSENEIIVSKSIEIAGDVFNESIIKSIKESESILIGQRTAEDLKIAAFKDNDHKKRYYIRGKDIKTNLPKEISVSIDDVLSYIEGDIIVLTKKIKEIIEELSPEIISDIKKKGIYILGGGSYINFLVKNIAQEIKVDIKRSQDPMLSVVKGTLKIASNREKYSKYFIKE